MFKRSEVRFRGQFSNFQKSDIKGTVLQLKNGRWWPGQAEQGAVIVTKITTIITLIIIITIINTIGNGDLEEQSKEWETKEEQKSSRDQGRQKVDRDVAGNRELGFCSTFVVEN